MFQSLSAAHTLAADSGAGNMVATGDVKLPTSLQHQLDNIRKSRGRSSTSNHQQREGVDKQSVSSDVIMNAVTVRPVMTHCLDGNIVNDSVSYSFLTLCEGWMLHLGLVSQMEWPKEKQWHSGSSLMSVNKNYIHVVS